MVHPIASVASASLRERGVVLTARSVTHRCRSWSSKCTSDSRNDCGDEIFVLCCITVSVTLGYDHSWDHCDLFLKDETRSEQTRSLFL